MVPSTGGRRISDRHFGEAQPAAIAQDVERIFHELVVTGEDGFKAIDYSSCRYWPFRLSRN
jgi:hypothetical protein